MSANRSVQAAQRRRAGPANGEPPIPGRSPQPSINSAQIFANQARPGQGPNIPPGRLAGQQAASQQKQMQQQYGQQQDQRSDKLSGLTKMTISQAITLITLRLGAVETKLMNIPEGGESINIDGETELDSGFLQSIVSRLESLEQRSVSTNGTTTTPELNLLKQQVDTLKQAVVQTKSSTTSLAKENTALKQQMDSLKKELTETKELLTALQNLTMDNTQKIFDLSVLGSEIPSLNELENNEIIDLEDSHDNTEQNEIIGTDLKQLIESELNMDSM